jgi:hypothetical protein
VFGDDSMIPPAVSGGMNNRLEPLLKMHHQKDRAIQLIVTGR